MVVQIDAAYRIIDTSSPIPYLTRNHVQIEIMILPKGCDIPRRAKRTGSKLSKS